MVAYWFKSDSLNKIGIDLEKASLKLQKERPLKITKRKRKVLYIPNNNNNAM